MRAAVPARRAGRARVLLAALVGLLVGATGWAVVAGRPDPSRQLTLTAGSAWLVTPDRGLVTLIDGATGQIAATATTPSGNGLTIVQDGLTAFVADSGAGTVTRIDAATGNAGASVTFGAPGETLSVLVRHGRGFVVNADTRVLTTIDPVSLAVVERSNLPVRPGTGQLLLDASGRLWAVDAAGGGMSWLDPDGSTGLVAATAGTELLSVDDRPVWLQRTDGQLRIGWLAADGSRTGWNCTLGVDGSARFIGASTAEQVLAVTPAGQLLVAESGSGCGDVIELGAGDFGEPVQVAELLIVADRATGSALVVDVPARRVLATVPLTAPGNDLELVTADGIVFYNDRDSERAGVLRRADDGTWSATTVSKYDPATGEPNGAATSTPADGTTPDAAARSCSYQQAFNRPIEPAWYWVDTDVEYGVSLDRGRLTVTADDGADLFDTTVNAPRLLRSIAGDFSIEVELQAQPRQFYQGAGLVVWAAADRFVRIERGFGDAGVINLQYRDGGDHLTVHGPTSTAPDAVVTEEPAVALRLTKTATEVTAAWRPAYVAEWTELGAVPVAFPDSVQAGLTVLNRAQGGAVAEPFAAAFLSVDGECLT